MSDLPETPQGLMHLLPNTSSQIESFSRGIINAVHNGEENPLNVLLQIRAMEKAFKTIYEQIKDNVNTEADKYPGVEFTFRGNQLVKGDVKTEYDYTVCNDTVWEQLKVDADAAKTKLDDRQSFLKALKDPIDIMDPMTGELVTVRPPLKKTVQGVKFFIK
jgi:hypothetical protein